MIRAARSRTTIAASAKISGVSANVGHDTPYSRTSRSNKLNERTKTPASRAGLRSFRAALVEVRMVSGRGRGVEPEGCHQR